MDENCDDYNIINGLKAGDQQYLKIFVDRFATRLFALVMKRGFSRPDAEEAVNDTLYKAIRYINDFDTGRNTKFFTWLATIALNTAWDQYQKTKRAPVTESIEDRAHRGIQDTNGSWPEPADPGGGKEPLSRVLLKKALERLSETDQRILLARARGYQHKEIGEWLDKSQGAVKVAHHRALKKLKAKYISLLESLEDRDEIKTLKTYLNIGGANGKAAS